MSTLFDGGRKGKLELRAVKKVIVREVFRSRDTTSKYHQSKEFLLTADNWGPSRLSLVDREFAVIAPANAFAGIVLICGVPPRGKPLVGISDKAGRIKKSQESRKIFILNCKSNAGK